MMVTQKRAAIKLSKISTVQVTQMHNTLSIFSVNLLLDIPVTEGKTVFPLLRFCLLFHMAENDHSNLVKYSQPGGKTCVSCLFTMAYRTFQ